MGIIENKRVIKHKRTGNIRQKRRVRNTVLKILAFLCLAGIAVALYFASYMRYEKVDLKELISITISGYDSKGSIGYVVDESSSYRDFLRTVEVVFDKSENISNGDEITVICNYDKALAKEMKLRVTGKERKVVIDNLPEANIITEDEVFEDVDIISVGISPFAEIELVNMSQNEIIDNIEFQVVDQKEYYRLGDVVTVKALIDEDYYTALGIAFEDYNDDYQREYTVKGIEEYITDPADLTPEIIAAMKEKAVSLFGNDSGDANEYGLRVFTQASKMYSTENGKYTFRWGRVNFISAYFSLIKSGDLSEDGGRVNDVKMVFESNISQSDGNACYAEAVVIFRNIKRDLNGELKVDLDDASIISVSARDSEIKNIVNPKDNKEYEVTKLEW